MWPVLFVCIFSHICVAVCGMQPRTMFYSLLSYKAGLERKLERIENKICFRKETKTCSLVDLQINAWKESQIYGMFSQIKDMKTRFLLGQPHGPAQILLDGGRLVFTQFRLGTVEGLILVVDGVAMRQVSLGEKNWTFGDVGWTSFEYSDESGHLVIFEFQENIFSVGKLAGSDYYYRVSFHKKEMERGLLVPKFDIVRDKAVIKVDRLKFGENDLSFWFQTLSNYSENFMTGQNEDMRQDMTVFKSLSHIVYNYMNETNFIKDKITAHIPSTEADADCGGILQTRQLPNMARTGFTGFPGSGNTWVRFLLESSTGIATQSQNPPSVRKHQDRGCFLTFNHYWRLNFVEKGNQDNEVFYPMDSQTRLENLFYFNGRSVLLIRNPFKAIISFFVHRNSGTYSDSEFGALAKERNIFRHESYQQLKMARFYTKEFEDFATDNIEKWTRIVLDWVELGDTLVVHLEEVVENRIGQIRRILRFLNINPDERRLKCVKYGHFDVFKRQPVKFDKNPYPEYVAENIWSNIKIVNSALLKYGHKRMPTEKYKLF